MISMIIVRNLGLKTAPLHLITEKNSLFDHSYSLEILALVILMMFFMHQLQAEAFMVQGIENSECCKTKINNA